MAKTTKKTHKTEPKVVHESRTEPKVDGKDAKSEAIQEVMRGDRKFWVRRTRIIGTGTCVYSAWRIDHGRPNHEHLTITHMFGVCLGKVGTEVISDEIWTMSDKNEKARRIEAYRQEMWDLACDLIREAFPEAKNGIRRGYEIETHGDVPALVQTIPVTVSEAPGGKGVIVNPKTVSRGPLNKEAIADDDLKSRLQARLKVKPGTHGDIAKENGIEWAGSPANGGVLMMRLLNALRAKVKAGQEVKL